MTYPRLWPIDPVSRAVLVAAGIPVDSLEPLPEERYTTYFHQGAEEMFWGESSEDREDGARALAAASTSMFLPVSAPTFSMSLAHQPDEPGWADQRIMLARDVVFTAFGDDPPRIWLLGTLLPETLTTALKGRPIAEVIRHSLLADDPRAIHKVNVNRGMNRTVIYLPTKRDPRDRRR